MTSVARILDCRSALPSVDSQRDSPGHRLILHWAGGLHSELYVERKLPGQHRRRSCCKTESTHIHTVGVIGSNPIAHYCFLRIRRNPENRPTNFISLTRMPEPSP